jgi:WD40 repeat protein
MNFKRSAVLPLGFLLITATLPAQEAMERKFFYPIQAPVLSLAFTPDGKALSAAVAGTIVVSDANTGKELARFDHADRHVTCLAFSPDGKVLAAAGGTLTPLVSWSNKCSIKLWDATTHELCATLPAREEGFAALAFAGDGKTLASACIVPAEAPPPALTEDAPRLQPSGRVTLWDVKTGKARSSRKVAGIPLAFGPDCQTVATTSDAEGWVKVWEAGTGKERVGMKAGYQSCAAFSPNGKLLATGLCCGVRCIKRRAPVVLWDLIAGKERATLEGHTVGVVSLAFSPGGTLLASAGQDHTVRLWDVATGKEVAVLRGHSDWVMSVAFSSDGKALASGGQDHTARVWDVAKLVGKRAER